VGSIIWFMIGDPLARAAQTSSLVVTQPKWVLMS
jgi:hypothetical protein